MSAMPRVTSALKAAENRSTARLAFIREFANRTDSALTFTPRQRTALNLAHCLHEFAALQFRFFQRGFTPAQTTDASPPREPIGYLLGRPGAKPTFDLIYPIEYAFERTQTQINHDLDVIFRVISHRTPALSTPALTRHLEHADQLANLALQPAVAAGLIKPVTVLTYFQKSPSIRIIPYAPVALTGIPFTPNIRGGQTQERVRDVMLIPHEIGHQVFWRLAKPDIDSLATTSPLPTVRSVGKFIEETCLRPAQQLSASPLSPPDSLELPNWLLNWTEEIFADVYGCLIAGVLCAASIQQILKGLPVDQFLADDGEHPCPVVRPLIHIHVLEMSAQQATPDLAEQLNQAAGELRKKWRGWLLDRRIPLWFRPQGSAHAVTLEEAETLLRQVVSAMLASAPMQKIMKRAPMWTTQLKEGAQLSSQTAATPLQAAIARQADFALLELVQKDAGLLGWHNSDDDNFRPGRLQDYDFVRLRDDALEHGAIPAEPTGFTPWWLAILEAGSWLTGPGGPGHVQG